MMGNFEIGSEKKGENESAEDEGRRIERRCSTHSVLVVKTFI